MFPFSNIDFLLSGKISTTEHSGLEGVTIKLEPGTKEEKDGDFSNEEIDVEVTDIKKDCSETPEGIHQTAGKPFLN